MVWIFDALNSWSYEPGLGKGLPATAGNRFMNWAEFVGTESHSGSPSILGEWAEEFQRGQNTNVGGSTVLDRIAMGWESRSNCRISVTLSSAATLPLTSSTPSAGGKATGACRLQDRERPRTGN